MFSFDSQPIVFLGVGYGLLWLTSALALAPAWLRPPSIGRNKHLFLWLALGALAFMRFPILVFNRELNPDESQIITQALTLHQDPVFWRSVDGTTGGPLDSYLLALPGLLGLPFNYIVAHGVALLLVMASLWLLFRTLERWFGEEVARWALMPSLILLAMTQNADLVHYSSEHLPILFLGLLYANYARVLQERLPSPALLYGTGLVAGLVPFGKLQAVPMMACVGLFVVVDLLTRRQMTLPQKARRIAWLLLGGLSFPLLVVLLTLWKGVFDDMMTFYVVANLKYGSGGNPWAGLLRIPAFLAQVAEFSWFIWLSIGLAGLFLLSLIRSRFRVYTDPKIWIFILVLIGFVLLAITRTGSEYKHYLLFLIAPVGLLNGWLLSEIRHAFRSQPNVPALIAAGALAAVLIPYGVRYVNWKQNHEPLNLYVQDSRMLPQSAVTQQVLRYARPGEKLAVWGWECRYYVEAQMPQGVNENHTIRCIFDHPLRDAYRERYVRDLERSRPPVFIDAVGHSLWVNDRATQGYESIAPLRAFVAAHYHFVDDIDKTRIYVRNDRYKSVPVATSYFHVD